MASQAAFVSHAFLAPRKRHASHLLPTKRPRLGVAHVKAAPCARLAYGTPSIRTVDSLPVVHIPGLSRRLPPPLWPFVLIAAGLAYLARLVVIARHLARPYVRADLNNDIAAFYDARSAAWEAVWGEHMHHGLYDRDEASGKPLRGRLAQIRTMTELLALAGAVPRGARVADIGCGIGGASRFLARAVPESDVTGITLSAVQAARANELNRILGLDDRVRIEVRDALDTGFPDNHFDLVWSLESGEHMADKNQFIRECTRILKPGGKLVVLAWCVRESAPRFSVGERFAIRRIMEEYCLPRVAPASEYATEMVRAGVRGVCSDDWTKRAAPFWGEVAFSAAFSRKGWAVLRKYGWPLMRSALAMRHVIAGIWQGVFRLVALSGRKPLPEEEEREAEAERLLHPCSTTSLPLA